MNLLRSKSASVLIVESQSECLLRCADAVQKDEQLSLVAAVSSAAAAIGLMDQHAPDVVLVDLQISDLPAIEVIRHATWHCPHADIVVLTQFGNDEQVLACIEAGATAYLFKDTVTEQLATSIHQWRDGSAPISPSMARRVLGRFRLQPSVSHGAAWASAVPETTHPLTANEAGILRWIARGMSLEQIGDLASSPQQLVLVHVKRIYRKLAAHARGERLHEHNEADAGLNTGGLAA